MERNAPHAVRFRYKYNKKSFHALKGQLGACSPRQPQWQHWGALWAEVVWDMEDEDDAVECCATRIVLYTVADEQDEEQHIAIRDVGNVKCRVRGLRKSCQRRASGKRVEKNLVVEWMSDKKLGGPFYPSLSGYIRQCIRFTVQDAYSITYYENDIWGKTCY
ncbi:hypothetical protein K435DRAFT_796743 [Dendrothele bispora CBS 962.96]|uniref:Uncharacterized protein n=1 Tax=Dendrothele bispora (strain CBS 962.96) TaxID=1314807 RepID=A0A4S8M589_DENBC|nr:hypothetical protein K435DRAFT_796743 [Dendrothele bispora CBS 962.96]